MPRVPTARRRTTVVPPPRAAGAARPRSRRGTCMKLKIRSRAEKVCKKTGAGPLLGTVRGRSKCRRCWQAWYTVRRHCRLTRVTMVQQAKTSLLGSSSWLLRLYFRVASWSSLSVALQTNEYPCPAENCWCHDSVEGSAIIQTHNVSYSTVFNPLSNREEDLTLDIYAPPLISVAPASVAPALRPVALIIHGGGFSPNGEHSGKRQEAIRERAQAFARRGFVAVSIDYRCERPYGGSALWVDSVIDARSALSYLAANQEALYIDISRIVAYGTSAGAVIVEGLAYFKDPSRGTHPRIKGSISISGCLFNDSTSLPAHRHVWNHLYNASKDSPALIDFHGTADPVVPYENATARGGPDNKVCIADRPIDHTRARSMPLNHASHC
eukprot:COSAG02_NODE_382_length_23409_cov_45.812999_5_plen_383_part_00